MHEDSSKCGTPSRMASRRQKRNLWAAGLLLLSGAALCVFSYHRSNSSVCSRQQFSKKVSTIDDEGNLFEYDRESPLIFVGGMPRSGTTLVRAMLDAHPDVRCGAETRVVPRILQMRARMMRSGKETMRLKEAGLTSSVIDSAVSAFILEAVARHGPPAPRLCNKDPFTLKSGAYLRQLFPNGKFLFAVRDGRATVHSIISRNVTITGFAMGNYRQCLGRWNSAVSAMNDQCAELGERHCMRVPYEQLVLHPKEWMSKVLDFLGLEWSERVLHHDERINKKGGVVLSRLEKSTDQVIKPVNVESLMTWVGQVPEDVLRDIEQIAPMLEVLGYDPKNNSPSYGVADPLVRKNTQDVRDHEAEWESRARKIRNTSKVMINQ